MTLWPLSQGELHGVRESFLDTLMTEPDTFRAVEPSSTTRDEYTDAILNGGMSIAVAAPTESARLAKTPKTYMIDSSGPRRPPSNANTDGPHETIRDR